MSDIKNISSDRLRHIYNVFGVSYLCYPVEYLEGWLSDHIYAGLAQKQIKEIKRKLIKYNISIKEYDFYARGKHL